jgi:hypothetical protein
MSYALLKPREIHSQVKLLPHGQCIVHDQLVPLVQDLGPPPLVHPFKYYGLVRQFGQQ